MRRKIFLGKTTKKLLGFVLAATVAVTGIPFPASQVKAADGDILVNGTGPVESGTTREVSIGNDSLSRTFKIENGRLKTGTITNGLGKSDFTPARGSEEFVIRTVGKAGSRVELEGSGVTLTSLRETDKASWNLTVNSDQANPQGTTNKREGGGTAALLDGQVSTFYHSQYEPNIIFPVEFTLDRGNKTTPFQTFGYKGRPEGPNANGMFSKIEMYASDSNTDLFSSGNKLVFSDGTKVGKIDLSGAYDGNTPKWVYLSLRAACDKRYVGIKVIESQKGTQHAAGSEIDLFAGKYDSIQGGTPGDEIKASDLELVNVTSKAYTTEGGKEGNEGKKEGQLLTFTFAPIQWGAGAESEINKGT